LLVYIIYINDARSNKYQNQKLIWQTKNAAKVFSFVTEFLLG